MEQSLHTLTLGRGSNTFLRNIFQVDIFILEIARLNGLAGILFNLRLEGKKRISMSCLLLFILRFSVTGPFLTLFYYVEKRNGINLT